MRVRRGMNLQEVVFIATVVGVLLNIAAMFMRPIVCGSRPAARNAACSGNSRQLVTGFQLYAATYDDHLPAVYQCGGATFASGLVATAEPRCGSGYRWTWMHLIEPYVRDRAAFHCPDDKRPAWPGVGRDPASYGYNFEAATRLKQYGWCQSDCGRDLGTPGKPGTRRAEVGNPAGTLLLTDSRAWAIGPGHNGDGFSGQVAAVHEGARHEEKRVNCTFVDGHVKSLPYSQIMSGNNRAVWRYWTTTAD